MVRVKITDFGLARMVDDVRLTQNGVVAGTPEYMAPEQAKGGPIDHRADLFSLGGVLYALCTGRPPFRGESALAVLMGVANETPTPVRELNPDIPVWLETLIGRLMAKDPAERFQSAAEVAALLEGYLAHLRQPEVAAPALPPAPERPGARKRLGAWLALRTLLVVAGGLFGVWVLLFQAAPLPPPAPPGDIYQDFRTGQPPLFPWQVVGPDSGNLTRPEVGGFRITLPRDRKRGDQRVGVELNTRLKGDFEVTSSYEILGVEQNIQGHGVAFAILVKTDTPRNDVVELARSTRQDSGEVYNCARISTDDQGKRTHKHHFPPANSKQGRLRLTRRGAEVTYWAAEGLNGEFEELHQTHLGTEDVIGISATGFTGYAPNFLDLRILDLRVRGQSAAAEAAVEIRAFPGQPTPAPVVLPPTQEKPRSHPWLAALGLIGLLVLLTALGIWLMVRRRQPVKKTCPAPARGKQAQPTATAPALSLLCSCGKKLEVKPQLAGKKVRCPACQKPVQVPEAPTSSSGYRERE
jgi:hypothetical protein